MVTGKGNQISQPWGKGASRRLSLALGLHGEATGANGGLTAYAVCALFLPEAPGESPAYPGPLQLSRSVDPGGQWPLNEGAGIHPRLARACSAFPVGLPSPTTEPRLLRATRGQRPLPARPGCAERAGSGWRWLGVGRRGRRTGPARSARGCIPVHPRREGGPTAPALARSLGARGGPVRTWA